MRAKNGEGLTNGRDALNGDGMTSGPGLVNGTALTGPRGEWVGGLHLDKGEGPPGLTLRRDLINGFSIEGRVEWRPRRKHLRRRMEELAEAPMPGE